MSDLDKLTKSQRSIIAAERAKRRASGYKEARIEKSTLSLLGMFGYMLNKVSGGSGEVGKLSEKPSKEIQKAIMQKAENRNLLRRTKANRNNSKCLTNNNCL